MTKNDDGFLFEKYLLLDSRDRESSTSLSGVETLAPISTFNFYYPVDASNTAFLAVHSCNMENHFNNINIYNNILSINNEMRVIPIGNYTLAELLVVLNAFTLTGLTLTFTHSALTGFITIAGTIPFTILSGNYLTANYDKYVLSGMLGFTVYPISSATSITAVMKPSMYYTRFIDIRSTRLTAYTISDEATSKKTRNNLLRLFVNSPLPVVEFQNTLLNKFYFEESSNIGTLDLEIYDEWGMPALLLGEFTINLLLFKKTNVKRTFYI